MSLLFKKWSMLSVCLSSYGCTREVGRAREKFEWQGAKPNASLASRLLSQLPACIHNSIDALLKHGPCILEH